MQQKVNKYLFPGIASIICAVLSLIFIFLEQIPYILAVPIFVVFALWSLIKVSGKNLAFAISGILLSVVSLILILYFTILFGYYNLGLYLIIPNIIIMVISIIFYMMFSIKCLYKIKYAKLGKILGIISLAGKVVVSFTISIFLVLDRPNEIFFAFFYVFITVLTEYIVFSLYITTPDEQEWKIKEKQRLTDADYSYNTIAQVANIGLFLFLSFITLGIFKIIWCAKITRKIKILNNEVPEIASDILCLIFVPFYIIFWTSTMAKKLFKSVGEVYELENNNILYTVLSCVSLYLLSIAFLQNDLNKIAKEVNKERYGYVNEGEYENEVLTRNLLLKVKNPGLSILFSILTLGIYYIVWRVQITRRIKLLKLTYPGCAEEAILFIFVPFYASYWMYENARKLASVSENYQVKINRLLYLILHLVGLGVVATALLQDDLNNISRFFKTEDEESKYESIKEYYKSDDDD